jgi:hypothetical protein
MSGFTPLSAETSIPVGIIAVLLLGVVVLYSLRIAYTILQGYRSASTSGSGLLAAGLLLLTIVPIVLSFVVGTYTSFSPQTLSAVILALEIIGLGLIISSLYGPRGEAV